MNIAAISCILLVAAACSFAAEPQFAPAAECALCHTRIPAPGGAWSDGPESAWIGPHALWKSSMMAHSSQDPYWRAKVRFEMDQPSADAAAVQDFCLRCHAPAQQYSKRVHGDRLSLPALDELGVDGVTCTVCHQITERELGRESSYNAGFFINTEQQLFGPHARPFTMPMLHHTGFEAKESRHVLESALCATCHTVVVRTANGPLIEQGPYLEWLESKYPEEQRTCQDCHMPKLREPQYIAHRPPGGPFPPTEKRTPFGKHELIGGNATMLSALGHPAAAQRATERLKTAVQLTVSAAKGAGRAVSAVVEVRNLAGHKLPTGFPSRRLWLHVSVLDREGHKLFESGDWDLATNELVAGPAIQPDHNTISRAAQVKVFEVESDTQSLLRATRHIKDNRISPAARDPRTGMASARYELRLPAGAIPDRVRVEAVFQTVKPSHVPPGAPGLHEVTRPIVIATAEAGL